MRVAALLLFVACSAAPRPDAGCGADLQTDSQNCGACGVVCDAATRCESGLCVPTCAGLVCAGGVCVDPSTDPRNCGGCGRVCTAQHAAAVCSAGRCSRAACAPGWFDCDEDLANGCESDTPSCVVNVCGRNDAGVAKLCAAFGLSADGQTLLLTSRDPHFADGDPTSGEHLYIYRRASGLKRRLTRRADGGFVTGTVGQALLSGDGTRAVFDYTGELLDGFVPGNTYYLADLENGRLSVVGPPDPGGIAGVALAGLSHNGRYLALFVDGRDGGFAVRIDLTDPTGTSLVAMPSNDTPVLSPSGDVLVVRTAARGDAFGVGDLMRYDARDAGLGLLLAPPASIVGRPHLDRPALSFDGARFAVSTSQPGWAEDAGFSTTVLLGPRRPDGGLPWWYGRDMSLSYDGRVLAVDNVVIGDACMAIDVDTGAELARVTTSFGFCTPLLSGDGRTLLYQSGSEVFVVPVKR